MKNVLASMLSMLMLSFFYFLFRKYLSEMFFTHEYREIAYLLEWELILDAPTAISKSFSFPTVGGRAFSWSALSLGRHGYDADCHTSLPASVLAAPPSLGHFARRGFPLEEIPRTEETHKSRLGRHQNRLPHGRPKWEEVQRARRCGGEAE